MNSNVRFKSPNKVHVKISHLNKISNGRKFNSLDLKKKGTFSSLTKANLETQQLVKGRFRETEKLSVSQRG